MESRGRTGGFADQDDAQRRQALEQAIQAGRRDLVPAMLAELARPSARSAAALLRAVGYLGDASCCPAVSRYIVAPDPETRLAALRALARLRAPAAIPILVRAATADPEPAVRAQIVEILGTLKPERLRSVLVEMIANPHGWVRRAAVKFAATHLGQDAAPILQAAARCADPPLAAAARAQYIRLTGSEEGLAPAAPPARLPPTPTGSKKSRVNNAVKLPWENFLEDPSVEAFAPKKNEELNVKTGHVHEAVPEEQLPVPPPSVKAPAPPAPPPPRRPAPSKMRDCPVCGSSNSINAIACAQCAEPFKQQAARAPLAPTQAERPTLLFIIAVLYIIIGSLSGLGGVIGLSGGNMFSLILVLIGIFYAAVGFDLMKGKSWARTAAIALIVLGFFSAKPVAILFNLLFLLYFNSQAVKDYCVN